MLCSLLLLTSCVCIGLPSVGNAAKVVDELGIQCSQERRFIILGWVPALQLPSSTDPAFRANPRPEDVYLA